MSRFLFISSGPNKTGTAFQCFTLVIPWSFIPQSGLLASPCSHGAIGSMQGPSLAKCDELFMKKEKRRKRMREILNKGWPLIRSSFCKNVYLYYFLVKSVIKAAQSGPCRVTCFLRDDNCFGGAQCLITWLLAVWELDKFCIFLVITDLKILNCFSAFQLKAWSVHKKRLHAIVSDKIFHLLRNVWLPAAHLKSLSLIRLSSGPLTWSAASLMSPDLDCGGCRLKSFLISQTCAGPAASLHPDL